MSEQRYPQKGYLTGTKANTNVLTLAIETAFTYWIGAPPLITETHVNSNKLTRGDVS